MDESTYAVVPGVVDDPLRSVDQALEDHAPLFFGGRGTTLRGIAAVGRDVVELRDQPHRAALVRRLLSGGHPTGHHGDGGAGHRVRIDPQHIERLRIGGEQVRVAEYEVHGVGVIEFAADPVGLLALSCHLAVGLIDGVPAKECRMLSHDPDHSTQRFRLEPSAYESRHLQDDLQTYLVRRVEVRQSLLGRVSPQL